MEIRSSSSAAVTAVKIPERNGFSNVDVLKPSDVERPSKELLPQDKAAEQPSSPAQLDQSIKKINESLKANGQGLEFTLDDDNGKVIVKVIDQGTKEVIRQMPSEEALEIAKAMDQAIGLLIKQTA